MQLVIAVIARARAHGLSARAVRRMLRLEFDGTGIAPWIRYAAVRDVTGFGVLDLPDPCQVALLRADKTRPRRRAKENHAAR